MIDALSTIMWPNMVRKPSKAKGLANTNHRNGLPSLLEGGEDGSIDDDDVNIEIDDVVIRALGSSLMSMDIKDSGDSQKFKMDFERWLESKGEEETSIPKRSQASMSDFPVPSTSYAIGSSSRDLKFDDDFGPFQAIPSPISQHNQPPPPTLSSQSSLADHPAQAAPNESVTNQTFDRQPVDADADEGLPTRAEILETSRRLFPHLVAASSHKPSSSNLAPHPDANASEIPENEDALDHDEQDPSLDLTSILSSLQGMKEEIANMPDMEARRKAAARVALGLVWALEGDQ